MREDRPRRPGALRLRPRFFHDLEILWRQLFPLRVQEQRGGQNESEHEPTEKTHPEWWEKNSAARNPDLRESGIRGILATEVRSEELGDSADAQESDDRRKEFRRSNLEPQVAEASRLWSEVGANGPPLPVGVTPIRRPTTTGARGWIS